MDIQFVLDVYACAMYIVSYISKAQRGISDLLRTACEEAKSGNSTVQQQVRDIGGKFLNAVEISAHEAVYIALQLPMRRSSREVIFVNTSPARERLHLLKSMEEINKMSDDCEEVNCSSLITKYSQRPLSLENVTLADFAALYYNTNSFLKNSFQELVDSCGFPLEDHDDDNVEDYLENEPCDTNQKHKQRKKARVIRSVWFNKEIDEENHFRELLMLFTYWRDESDLFKFGSFKQGYLNCKNQIESQMKQYAVCQEALEQAVQTFEMNGEDDVWDLLPPTTQHSEQQDSAQGFVEKEPDVLESYDFSEDLHIPSTHIENQTTLNELPDVEYRQLVSSLNKEQK